MRQVIINRNNGTINKYYLYESVQEAKYYNIEPVDIHVAEPGDYIQTNNGWYLPFIEKYNYKNTAKLKFWRFNLARLTVITTQFVDTKNWSNLNIIFDPEKNVHDYARISPRAKLFAQCLRMLDPYEAFQKIFKRKATFRELLNLFQQPRFWAYIKENDIMITIRDAMEKEKVDPAFLVKELKSVIQDKATKAPDKLKALLIVKDMIEINIPVKLPARSDETITKTEPVAVFIDNKLKFVDQKG